MNAFGRIRASVFVVALLVATICVILLLNVTAPNPTGRRYSSADPQHVAAVLGVHDWRAAELILEADLGVPFNDDAATRTCLCQTDTTIPPGRCNACALPSVAISQSYTLPDFLTERMVADSKYVQTFSLDTQINDFLLYAQVSGREIWIYTRTDTIISASVLESIRATGGDVVPYFVVEGFYDPIESGAGLFLIISLIVFGVLATLQFVAYLNRDTPDAPSAEDTIDKAQDKVDETEAFMERVERLSRREIDEEDSRHEDQK